MKSYVSLSLRYLARWKFNRSEKC